MIYRCKFNQHSCNKFSYTVILSTFLFLQHSSAVSNEMALAKNRYQRLSLNKTRNRKSSSLRSRKQQQTRYECDTVDIWKTEQFIQFAHGN